MSQEIALRHTAPPSPQTLDLVNLLGVYRNSIETEPSGKSWITAGQEPSAADRAVLESRRAEIVACRVPLDREHLVEALSKRIARMFLRFPSSGRLDNAMATASAYAADIAEFPLWAIDAGIQALLRGEGLQNKDFVPSSITVRAAVLKQIAKADAELRELNRILDVEVVKPTGKVKPDWLDGQVKDVLGSLSRAQRNDALRKPDRVEAIVPGEGADDYRARQLANAASVASRPSPGIEDLVRRKPYPWQVRETETEASASPDARAEDAEGVVHHRSAVG